MNPCRPVAERWVCVLVFAVNLGFRKPQMSPQTVAWQPSCYTAAQPCRDVPCTLAAFFWTRNTAILIHVTNDSEQIGLDHFHKAGGGLRRSLGATFSTKLENSSYEEPPWLRDQP